MTNRTPSACSLGPSDLRQRLNTIAEIGADSLIGRGHDGDRHLLYFRSDRATRRRLEEIVTAEAECCAFLDLTLEDRGEELLLSVAAPRSEQVAADEIAAAFASESARRTSLRITSQDQDRFQRVPLSRSSRAMLRQ
jgi:hypothetical protein